MLLIGLTGGIACGKSTVSQILQEEYNIQIIDADCIVRKLQEPNSSCTRRIARRWPQCVDQNTCSLNRVALGQIVFADKEARKELGKIMNGPIMRAILWEIWKAWWSDAFIQFTGKYPQTSTHQTNSRSGVEYNILTETSHSIPNVQISDRVSHFAERAFAESEYKGRIVILDAPTLFETNFFTHFIASSLVIACSESIQVKRLMERSTLTESEALERIHAQMPLDEKRRRAGYVIENECEDDNFTQLHTAVANSVIWMSTLSGVKLTMIITGVVIGCTSALTAAVGLLISFIW